jgi:hypothetical protein
MKKPVIKESGKIIYRGYRFVQGVAGITNGKLDEEYVTFDVCSGTYSFRVEESA